MILSPQEAQGKRRQLQPQGPPGVQSMPQPAPTPMPSASSFTQQRAPGASTGQMAPKPVAQAPAAQPVPSPSSMGLPAPTQNLPGGATGTPTQPGAPQSSNLDDLNKLYEDILGQHDAAWGEQQKMLEAQMGAGQRRADALNASMGRSIGGGYAGLQAQAQLSGMNNMSQARLASDEQRRGLQLSWLDKQLEEKRRQEERGWQQADNADQQRMDTIQMMVSAMGDEASPELLQAMMDGDWDKAEALIQGQSEQTAADEQQQQQELLDKGKRAEKAFRQQYQHNARSNAT